MSLRIVSVNIEGDKHLPKVSEFLRKENADVVALAEVMEKSVDFLAGDSYPHRVYASNVVKPEGEMGVAFLSRYPLISQTPFYCGEYTPDSLPPFGRGTHAPVVLFAEVQKEGDTFRLGVVHFSWTQDGGVDERQRRHTQKLLDYLEERGEFILMGDFNMPRGGEMYSLLAAHYHDNIPAHVTTTIDPYLHRVNIGNPGKLAFVVDYIWTTPQYHAENVQIVSGVSDHCAVKSDIVGS